MAKSDLIELKALRKEKELKRAKSTEAARKWREKNRTQYNNYQRKYQALRRSKEQ